MGQNSSSETLDRKVIQAIERLSSESSGLRSKLSIVLDTDLIKFTFLDYLKKEQSSDNLEFLLNLQEFRAGEMKGIDIYRKFCTERSPKSLFISQKTKTALCEVFECGSGDEPGLDVFNAAEVEMIKLVSQDSLPRFLESQEFQTLAKQYNSAK